MTKEFFDRQTDLTAAKILIYRQYLNSYLPKVLMQFGKCFIVDFFCGRGKNGNEDGSPLVLLDVAKKMLESPVIKKKWANPEIVIIFCDSEKQYCDDLTVLLNSMILPKGIKVVGPLCEDFKSTMARAVNTFSMVNKPKFFFLDPFTYSDVGIGDVKALMDVPAAEVLLFLPTFHSYRFVKCAQEVGALKKFLEDFTERGCADYEDIYDFNESIRLKLLKHVGLKYVRAVGLDEGTRKNALFYLTKHITGMLVMNKLVWKYASDGLTVKIKGDTGPTLFNLSTVSSNYAKMKVLLQNYIKEQKQLSNVEIIDFAAQSGFDTKYANDVLKDMKKQELIEVEYKQCDKIRGFYVADNHWDNEIAVIKYRG